MATDEMTAEQRLKMLEMRLALYDTLVDKLMAYARLTAKGRLMLKALGLS